MMARRQSLKRGSERSVSRKPRRSRIGAGTVPINVIDTMSDASIDMNRALDLLKNSTARTLHFTLSGYRLYIEKSASTRGHETVDIGPVKGLKLDEVDPVRKVLAAVGFTEVVPPAITGCFPKAAGFMPLCMDSPGLYKR